MNATREKLRGLEHGFVWSEKWKSRIEIAKNRVQMWSYFNVSQITLKFYNWKGESVNATRERLRGLEHGFVWSEKWKSRIENAKKRVSNVMLRQCQSNNVTIEKENLWTLLEKNYED